MIVAFLHPFIDEMLKRGVNKSELADRISLHETALFDPSVSVPANTVYAFLCWVAARTGICCRLGQRMAAGELATLLQLMNSANTVGDFFLNFGILSAKQNRAATYKLEVEGAVALWHLIKAKGACTEACYADAVATGFFVETLKSAARSDWEPSKIIAVLPDTSLV